MSDADSTVHIPLADTDLFATIDAADAALVEPYAWRIQWRPDGSPGAVRACGSAYIALHRLLLDPPKGLVVDHRDGDVLNNTRANLRVCTNAENSRNSKLRAHSSSGLRNVQWRDKGGGRMSWRATVIAHGKAYRKWFGPSDQAKLAASEWAKAMRIKLHGEFAYLPGEKKQPPPEGRG